MSDTPEILVLVVDDNQTNLIALKALLTHIDVDADCVQSGYEAIAAVERTRYQLIFMDLMMPGMDGFETARLIRRAEFGSGRHTPILALTALDAELSREKCVDAGMNDFVSKPISLRTLRVQFVRWVTQSLPSPLPATSTAPDGGVLPASATAQRIYGKADAKEILESFLRVTDDLLQSLSDAIAAKNVPAAGHFAHEVKASSLTVCAGEMAKLAVQLENAIRKEDWVQVIECYRALVAGFRRITEDLKTPVRGMLSRRIEASAP